MIKFKLNKFRSRIYFKTKPTIFEIFSLNEYIQCKYTKNIFGFNRFVKYTKFIDLVPGGSNRFNTIDLIENLYKDLDKLFYTISKNFKGVTLKEYYDIKSSISKK